jgi:hypothetical protein
MTEQPLTEKKTSLSKPTITTPFHVDFDWWKEHDHNWHVYLVGYLCENHRTFFESNNENHLIDSINPDTGEVVQTDQLFNILMNHCARQEGFIQTNGTLIDSVFRLFLSNGNKPLTAEEISSFINRPPETILKTLSGPRIYRGIKPF